MFRRPGKKKAHRTRRCGSCALSRLRAGQLTREFTLGETLETAYQRRAPRTLDPPWIAVYRVHTLPLLAAAIRTESDAETLQEMLRLTLILALNDTGIHLSPHTELMVAALLERAKSRSLPPGAPVTDIICDLGIAARLYAVRESHPLDLFERIGFVSALIAGLGERSSKLQGREGIHTQAVAIPSESPREEDWQLVCELPTRPIAEAGGQAALKAALVTVWRKAPVSRSRMPITRFVAWGIDASAGGGFDGHLWRRMEPRVNG